MPQPLVPAGAFRMLIPIGTDVHLRRRPIGNWILVALNVLIFLSEGTVGGYQTIQSLLPPLHGAAPSLNEYLTYQFRHGDMMHLAGNMLFLWIFGNAVCDRMGSLNYVVFYLAGGVFAGLVFAYSNNNPLLGASGAIAAVTTAFLVLFPRVHITLLLWLFIVMPLQLPAMAVIVFKIILWDNIVAPRFDSGMVSNVAYSAHLGGYAFGFATAMLLLMSQALPRNQFDLLALWDRWRRRTGTFADFGYEHSPPTTRRVTVEQVESRPLDEIAMGPADQLREDILDRLSEHDYTEAARLYDRLRTLDDTVVLPRRQQLELANMFAHGDRHADAVEAYEAFLQAYPNAADAFQVRLFVGLMCRRYLGDAARAAGHLRIAVQGLEDVTERDLAAEELARAELQLLGRSEP